MSDLASRLSHTGKVLVRSGIEIGRILRAIIGDRDAVTANLPSSQMFLSHLMSLDATEQQVTLACSDHKPANSALLASSSVTLRCNHRGAQFAFSCARPRPGTHSGVPAILMATPAMMLAVQHNRRAGGRTQVPLEADVRCRLRLGLISFDARLIDMGLDGKAYLLGDPAIPVCGGTRLQGVRIRDGERELLSVDIEVDEVKQAMLASGKRATRIGCRIVADRARMEEIVRLFIVDLE
jgi:c-di-GMP-binding flagellar brake protein YcgR